MSNENNIPDIDILLSKAFSELEVAEQTWVLSEIGSEEAFEEMRLSHAHLVDQFGNIPQIEPDPAIHKALLAAFPAKKRRKPFVIWLNNFATFLLPPGQPIFRKPGFQMAIACLLLIGFVWMVNPTENDKNPMLAQNDAAASSDTSTSAVFSEKVELDYDLLADNSMKPQQPTGTLSGEQILEELEGEEVLPPIEEINPAFAGARFDANSIDMQSTMAYEPVELDAISNTGDLVPADDMFMDGAATPSVTRDRVSTATERQADLAPLADEIIALEDGRNDATVEPSDDASDFDLGTNDLKDGTIAENEEIAGNSSIEAYRNNNLEDLKEKATETKLASSDAINTQSTNRREQADVPTKVSDELSKKDKDFIGTSETKNELTLADAELAESPAEMDTRFNSFGADGDKKADSIVTGDADLALGGAYEQGVEINGLTTDSTIAHMDGTTLNATPGVAFYSTPIVTEDANATTLTNGGGTTLLAPASTNNNGYVWNFDESNKFKTTNIKKGRKLADDKELMQFFFTAL